MHGQSVKYGLLLALIALTVSLCAWQLWRAQTAGAPVEIKREVLNESNIASAIESARHADLHAAYARVSGHNQGEPLYIANQRHGEELGFAVLQPFMTDAGTQIALWRGWVPADRRNPAAPPPVAQASEDRMSVSGRLRLFESLLFGSSEVVRTGQGRMLALWPSPETLSQAWGETSGLVLIPDNYKDQVGPVIKWQLPKRDPGKHYMYALQWGLLALYGIFALVYMRREKQQ